jgi:hypothetical protein
MSASARCAGASRAAPSWFALARQERDPRRLAALFEGPPAGVGSVRRQGSGLAEQQLALCERETVDSAMRQVAFP